MPKSTACMLVSGSSHPELARKISQHSKIKQGKVQIETFPDGEIGFRILENVHGKDVFVVQTIARHPNLYLMELFIMIDALKRAGSRSVKAVIPYFGYARQDRRVNEGDPLSAKLVAQLLETAGVQEVFTMDLHSTQIEGFFAAALVHLSSESLLIEAMRKQGWGKDVVVAPDIGSARRAQEFAQRLRVSSLIIDKHRMGAKSVESYALTGDVQGKDVVLVDDMISTGQTIVRAAEVCCRYGAKKIHVAATHGLCVNGMFEAMKDSAIEKMIITDTIPLETPGKKVPKKKVKVVSVAPLFAHAILQSI